MQRRQFIRLAGGGTVFAATTASLGLSGCSSAMPPDAIEAWRGPNASLLQGDVRLWLLSFAILAPHSHNLQSWVADLRTPGEITLTCDPTRLLPETDPFSRQIMMSHGTFLELLDMAARERGLRADIALFPEGAFGPAAIDGRPVARVRLVPDSTVVPDPLFKQVLNRHTNRNAYDLSKPVSAAACATLVEQSQTPAVRVGYAGADRPDVLVLHRRIASQAWRIELTTPCAIMESFKVLRVGAAEVSQYRDGLTLLDPVPVAMSKLGLFDRSKPPGADDYATTSQIETFNKHLDSTPGFVWMVTADNTRATQVAAGRAYMRLQLAATGLGLSMQPLQQALQEYPEQAGPHQEIRRLLGADKPGQTVQMWARVGSAEMAEPAPRRRLRDFIRT
jgi:hypothetical protein